MLKSMTTFCLAGLMLLLGIGSVAGMPLGIPPAPEDPVMYQVAPEECLFYITWAGKATPDPKSTNSTEQLLAEPEIRHLVRGIEKMVIATWEKNIAQQGPEAKAISNDMFTWIKVLMSSPTALFANVSLDQDGPQIEAGMVVNLGDKATAIKASLEKHLPNILGEASEDIQIGKRTWHRIQVPEPNAPPIIWNVIGRYLIIGAGENEKVVEEILARGRTPAPQWLTKLRGHIPIDRPATFSYMNIAKQIEMTRSMGGPMNGPMPGQMDGPADGPMGDMIEGIMSNMVARIQMGIKALGLDQVTALASASGLDKGGFVNRNLLALDGSPRGIFTLISGDTLTPEDLDSIPGDATLAFAMKLDPERVLETVLSIANEIDPQMKEQVLESIQELNDQLELDLEKDVFAALGDRWCFYNSPSENGPIFGSQTAVIEVDDPKRLAQAIEKFTNIARQQMDQGDPSPRIGQFTFAGHKIFYFDAQNNEFPATPAWCMLEDRLILAAFPQNVKAHLIREKSAKTLAASPAVSKWLESDANALTLTYVDVQSIFDLTYTFVPMLVQMASAELSKQGIPLDLTLVPSVPSIRPHLEPATVVLRRNEAGIELVVSHSLPCGDIMTTVPVVTALLLPAIRSARDAAGRARSMNNMKQILLAIHNRHDVFNEFPAAYLADDNGKPLLSWRVAILPFIEQQGLYEQFHLDEPWDSPHNKALIPLMPNIYRPNASSADPGHTNYLTIRGDDTIFPGDKGIKMAQIRDGLSNTIAVVEADDFEAVIWTKPDDFQPDEDDPFAGLLGLRPNGFLAGLADGSAHFITEDTDPEMLKAMFTRNGGEVVNFE